MNGYTRCLKALKWEKPDRIPVIPQNSDMSIFMSGYGMKECLYDGKKLGNALLEAQEKMGYDGIMIGPDASILAEALGCEVDYRDDDPPAVTAPVLESLDDVDRLKETDLTKNARIRAWLDATKFILEKSKGELFVICRADQGAFSLASLLRGSQEFMMDLAMEENPEAIRKLLEFCNRIHIRFAKLVKESGAHATTCGDAYCGPGLISPEMYRRYALPYQKEAVRIIQDEIGIPYSIHICGKTDEIHDSWPETGFILSSGCSMSANTRIDNVIAMVEAAREYNF